MVTARVPGEPIESQHDDCMQTALVLAAVREEVQELGALDCFGRFPAFDELATQVAEQLTAHDPLGAHVRDELGISEAVRARPVQAGLTSAAAFALGAALPLLASLLAPAAFIVLVVAGTSLVFLTGLGALSARAGIVRFC